MRKLLLGLAGAGLAVVLAALAVGAVFAEDDSSQSGPFDDFIARLAQNLGIGEDQLRQAVRQTQEQLIDEGEQAGRILPEMADRLRQRLTEGDLPAFGWHGHGRDGGRFGKPGHILHAADPVGVVAEETGLTREEVREELRQGKSLAQVGEEHGVGRDQLRDALVANVEESLQEAVQNGRLDQQRADEILEGYRQHVDDLLDRTRPNPRNGA